MGSTHSTGLPECSASCTLCVRPPTPFQTSTSVLWPNASLAPKTADWQNWYQAESTVAGTNMMARRARRALSTDSILHRPELFSRMRARRMLT